jgi:hypothetical protein
VAESSWLPVFTGVLGFAGGVTSAVVSQLFQGRHEAYRDRRSQQAKHVDRLHDAYAAVLAATRSGNRDLLLERVAAASGLAAVEEPAPWDLSSDIPVIYQ